MRFTVEESNLMYIHSLNGADTRKALIDELTALQSDLQEDEAELKDLSTAVINKLTAMTDEDFENARGEIVSDFEEMEDE